MQMHGWIIPLAICALFVIYITYIMLYMYISLKCKIICIFQEGASPLVLAVSGGHSTCVEHLLSAPGIDVNIKDMVSVTIEYMSFPVCIHLCLQMYVNKWQRFIL